MRRLGAFLILCISATTSVSCDQPERQSRRVDSEDRELSGRLEADGGAHCFQLTQADRALLDLIGARESARTRLRGHPGDFIHGEVDGTQDRGFLDNRTRAKTMKFENTSGFDVSSISGHITFRSEDGRELGSVPFVASGVVFAGDSAVLEVTSGELTGKGAAAQVVVESVHVWN
jgi:hypothetical protein